MGPHHLDLARLVEFGGNNSLNFDSLSTGFNIITNNSLGQLTDSAASATAIASGYKTLNSYLGLLPNGSSISSILEFASILNKSTGIVTTTEITHATPAAFYAHTDSRYDVSPIKESLLSSNVDIVLGGGKQFFDSSELNSFSSLGYDVVFNQSALAQSSSDKVFGLFANSHIPYVQDRTNEIPSLPFMTEIALNSLSSDSNGFFLMVEGGRIDHAGHANDKVNDVLETIEFDQVIGLTRDFVSSHPNTLLLVTADHETGGLQILGNSLDDNIPHAGLSSQENLSLRIERASNISVTYSSSGHTSVLVPLKIFSISENINLPSASTLENTEIFSIMKSYFNFNNLHSTDSSSLPINTTNSSSSSSSTTAIGFTFYFLLIIPVIIIFKKQH
jgi:alkaline phosphatase